MGVKAYLHEDEKEEVVKASVRLDDGQSDGAGVMGGKGREGKGREGEGREGERRGGKGTVRRNQANRAALSVVNGRGGAAEGGGRVVGEEEKMRRGQA